MPCGKGTWGWGEEEALSVQSLSLADQMNPFIIHCCEYNQVSMKKAAKMLECSISSHTESNNQIRSIASQTSISEAKTTEKKEIVSI